MSETPRQFRPFLAADESPQLVDCYVLSLDLLGTTSMTEEDASRNLEVTHGALHRATQWASGGDKSPTVASWFSDNLAMADVAADDRDPDPRTFGFHLVSAGWVQLELAMMGLFSRGGMTRGRFFASEMFVYGPALVDAYRLESATAIYPRVVLSPNLSDHALSELEVFRGGEPEIHRTLLAVDHDGMVFVNYLAAAFDEPGEVEAMLINHKTHIETRLDQHSGNPKVHLKYRWLADYHDRFCRLHYAAQHRGGLMIGAVEGESLVSSASRSRDPSRRPSTAASTSDAAVRGRARTRDAVPGA